MYHVIKKVKGHFYLYEQESFRDASGNVRTKSRYLGPVDKFTGEIKPAGDEPESVLINKIDLSKYKISLPVLEENYHHLTTLFARVGIDTKDFPKITLKHGKEVKFTKGLAGFSIYLPKNQAGNREKFKKAYRKAVSLAGLELLRQQRPKIFAEIRDRFDESYRQTQRHLTAYILNTNDYNRQYKAMVMKYFGVYAPTYGNPMKPDDLGLTGKKRKSWADEFGDIMAEIIRKGFGRVSADTMGKFKKAENSEKYALSEYLKQKKEINFLFRLGGWAKKAKKAYARASARRQAQAELRHKLRVLQEVFRH